MDNRTQNKLWYTPFVALSRWSVSEQTAWSEICHSHILKRIWFSLYQASNFVSAAEYIFWKSVCSSIYSGEEFIIISLCVSETKLTPNSHSSSLYIVHFCVHCGISGWREGLRSTEWRPRNLHSCWATPNLKAFSSNLLKERHYGEDEALLLLDLDASRHTHTAGVSLAPVSNEPANGLSHP